MFVWCRLLAAVGLASCVVFIVSLKCPCPRLTCILHLAIVGLKVASSFWRMNVCQIVLEAEFGDIRITVSFVAVSAFAAGLIAV